MTLSTSIIPLRVPDSNRTIPVAGGENLMRIAELYLGDATQWWRLCDANFPPGTPPDFILSAAMAQTLHNTLAIPPVNANVTWP